MESIFVLVALLFLFLAPLIAFAVLFVILSVIPPSLIPSSLSFKSIKLIYISLRGFFVLISISVCYFHHPKRYTRENSTPRPKNVMEKELAQSLLGEQASMVKSVVSLMESVTRRRRLKT